MRTTLLLEYAELSRDFDFPDDLEIALENDYVINKQYYSVEVLKCVLAAQLLGPMTPAEIVDSVKIWHEFRAEAGMV